MKAISKLSALAVGLLALPAGAVVTSTWTVETYQQFDAGDATNAFITSTGELRPGWDTKRTAIEGDAVWSALRLADGSVLLGSDANGAIFRFSGDTSKKLVTLPGAIAVVALAERGKLLNAPDTYMEKLAVGPQARGAIDMRRSPTENLRAIARSLGRDPGDLTVVILDRPRHEELIREVRTAGARIRLIEDGDVAGGVATCFPETGVDVLMGIGGAPEGVITAAAVKSVGGDMQGRLRPRNDDEIARARRMGVTDLDRIYTAEELAQGEVMFAATGVTSSDFLRGVRFLGGGAETWSVVMRSKTGTVRYVQAQHRFETKPEYFARQAGGR